MNICSRTRSGILSVFRYVIGASETTFGHGRSFVHEADLFRSNRDSGGKKLETAWPARAASFGSLSPKEFAVRTFTILFFFSDFVRSTMTTDARTETLATTRIGFRYRGRFFKDHALSFR